MSERAWATTLASVRELVSEAVTPLPPEVFAASAQLLVTVARSGQPTATWLAAMRDIAQLMRRMGVLEASMSSFANQLAQAGVWATGRRACGSIVQVFRMRRCVC